MARTRDKENRLLDLIGRDGVVWKDDADRWWFTAPTAAPLLLGDTYSEAKQVAAGLGKGGK